MTQEGNVVILGGSNSGMSGDKTEDIIGNNIPITGWLEDFWIVKLDTKGDKIWDKTIGSDSRETNILTYGFNHMDANHLKEILWVHYSVQEETSGDFKVTKLSVD